MKSIIVGIGEVGLHLARVLISESYDVIAIDQSEEACDHLAQNLDLMVICGSGTNPTLLKEAGINDASLLISVTNSDEINILTCLIASRCGVGTKIARVSDNSYFQNRELLSPSELGIDHLINSEELCAREFIRLLTGIEAREVVEFAEGKVQLIAFHIQSDNSLINQPIQNIVRQDAFSRIRFTSIKRKNGKTIIPKGSDSVLDGDEIFVMGSKPAVSELLQFSGIPLQHKLERLVIAGATPIGIQTAQMLESKPIQVTIIETDLTRAEHAVSVLKKATVLHGNYLDPDLLAEAQISYADSFISVTGDDEDDIMACVMAKSAGAERVIPLIQRPLYLPILASITELDSAVSRHLTAVNDILRLVRPGHVLAATVLRDIDAEVLELVVQNRSKVSGKKIHAIAFPDRALIGSVVRDGKVLIPTGDLVIQTGDDVIVCSQSKSIPSVEKLFV